VFAMTEKEKWKKEDLDKIEDVIAEQMADMLSAEHQLLDALQLMHDEATGKDLKKAIMTHKKETQTHVSRIEQAFVLLDRKAESETCDAMKGLIKEVKGMLDEKTSADIKDLSIILSSMKIEAYENASYENIKLLAQILDYDEIVAQVDLTIDEEVHAYEVMRDYAISILA